MALYNLYEYGLCNQPPITRTSVQYEIVFLLSNNLLQKLRLKFKLYIQAHLINRGLDISTEVSSRMARFRLEETVLEKEQLCVSTTSSYRNRPPYYALRRQSFFFKLKIRSKPSKPMFYTCDDDEICFLKCTQIEMNGCLQR